jgi:response regulator of citrate/malate metabolism
MTNNGALDTGIYKDLIGAYVIKNIKIQRIDDKIFDKENPRRLIAQNRAFIQKIIDSMSIKQAKQQINEEIIKESLALIEDIPVNNENKSIFISELGKLKSKSSQQMDFTAWMALFQIDVSIS